MPKIELPELQALAEYLTGKVPRYGMFSTLKGLIENSPKDSATAQEWQGYLKPGQIATRQGVEFPLKKEELEYSGLPNFFAQFQPNDKVSRADILQHYMENAPNLNVNLQSNQASRGESREALMLKNLGKNRDEIMQRVRGDTPDHSAYSHATRGDNPDNSASPWGSDFYQEDITQSPDFGGYQSHFSPGDISWNRTNRLPLWGESTGMGATGTPEGRTGRLIEEIQSDRHQKAVQPGSWNPTPEVNQRINELGNRLIQQGVDPEDMTNAWRFPQDVDQRRRLFTQTPEWQELMQLKKQSTGKMGYATPQDTARLKEIQNMPEYKNPDEFINRNRPITVDEEGMMHAGDAPPELHQRLEDLRREARKLQSQVPDTPFKTLQGYTSLEMRKALADALHTGDHALGLVTGRDQTAFYGNRFTEDQNKGQSNAYDVLYPPLLAKLAKQYGFGAKPMDVTLQVPRSRDRGYWPPRTMFDDMNLDYTQPVPTFNDWMTHNQGDLENERYNINRLFGYMRDRSTGDLMSARGHDPEAYSNAIRGMRTSREGMNNLEYEWNNAREIPENETQETRDAAWQAAQAENPDYLQHVNDYNQARTAAYQNLEPLYNAFKSMYGPQDPNVGNLRKKTFQNAIDLSDPDLVTKAKAAGIPVWNTGGEVDHVAAAAHLRGHYDEHSALQHAPAEPVKAADGGSVSDLVTGNNTGVDPKADYESGLTKLKDSILRVQPIIDKFTSSMLPFNVDSGDIPARAAVSMAKPFYGTDKSGHIVAGGRAWSSEQGGSPMSLLDTLTAMPHRMAQLADTIMGPEDNSRLRQWEKDWNYEHPDLASSPLLAGSKKAGERADAFDAKADRSVGLPEASTFAQHVADHAGDVIPFPGLAAEGAAGHLAGFLGASGMRGYPRMASEWAGVNGGLEALTRKLMPPDNHGQEDPEQLAHNAAGFADGGQPPPQPEAPTEDSLLNDMLQRRILMRETAPPVPLPPATPSPFDGGGLVDAAAGGFNWDDVKRRLAILRKPMIAGKPSPMVPQLPHVESSEDVADRERMKQTANRIMAMQGRESGLDSESMGPMHFSSANPEIMSLLAAKFGVAPQDTGEAIEQKLMNLKNQVISARPSNEEMKASAPTDDADQTMRKGGHAKQKPRASKVHGSMRARG